MVSLAAWSLLLLAGLSAGELTRDRGRPVDIQEYPSVVQIETRVGLVWIQTCVGTVITSVHVLTAAHCVTGPLVDNWTSIFRRVRAGTNIRGRDGVVANAEWAYRYPTFGIGEDGLSSEDNVAVIRLSSNLPIGPTIQQTRIIGEGYHFPANVPVNVVTWGRTAQSGVWADRELRSVDLLVKDHQECAEKYESLPVSIRISPKKICLGEYYSPGATKGLRDAGAPVFYNGVLVGVVAFGSPYGESLPLVSTSVSPFTNWIVEIAKY